MDDREREEVGTLNLRLAREVDGAMERWLEALKFAVAGAMRLITGEGVKGVKGWHTVRGRDKN